MLTKKQIDEIREHLEKAQNPLFFYDNDNDGLTSFLLLRRFIGRGKGVAIKSYPSLNESYYRKIEELKPDYIFILDKPVVSSEFLKKAKADNLPVVWIDHHQVKIKKSDLKGINYYNPLLNKDKKSEPVSYLSYKITNKKEDIWIAIIGCISDYFMPEFYPEFSEKYPELAKKNPTSPFDVLYKSEIGKIARMLDFSIKDKTTNVVNMQRFMIQAKSPYDILEENSKTKQIHKRYKEINTKYQALLKKARTNQYNQLVYFRYGGDMSLSYNLANQLSYEFPDKFIIVVYAQDDLAKISSRGKNIRDITLKAIKDIPDATGGGHRDATGAKIPIAYLPKFKEKIDELIKKQ